MLQLLQIVELQNNKYYCLKGEKPEIDRVYNC